MTLGGPAIRAQGLGKRYRLGRPQERHNTLRDALAGGARRLGRALAGRGPAGGRRGPELWALRDVGFEVAAGEVLGVVGRNGAGKSTLLKVLARITEPTEGSAVLYGRVGSLLEVGTGFHSELTGRENIFLSGAILGMRRSEIRRKFDEIVAFAEVEPFVDTPVKRYSSGMYLRLAFAVAAHLEPEILLVDEVLAVGDAAFQRKCLGKMGDVARQGRTVLFVSHNLVAVESLCPRAIWLSGGKLADDGPAGAVLARYVAASLALTGERVWTPEQAPGEDGVRLAAARVRPQDGAPGDPISVHTPVRLELDYWNLDPAAHVTVALRLFNGQDLLLFDVCPPPDPDWRRHPSPVGLLRTVCELPGDLLNDGLHRVALLVLRDRVPVVDEPEALVFNVLDSDAERDGWYGRWPGAIRPRLGWRTERVGEQKRPGPNR